MAGVSEPPKRYYKMREIYKPVHIEPIDLLDNGIERYEDHRGKAKMLIFNQINFENDYKPKRYVSRKDGNDLKATFTRFGFDVEQHVDLKKDAIFKKLEEVPKELKCIAIVVLSHGDKGKICAQDQQYNENDILKWFKNREDLTEFKDIRKLFIFQICRKKTPINLSLPDEDMIVLHSTYFDELSWRNTPLGSWFIQTLCKRLNLMKKENLLLDEMTFVMRDMNNHYNGEQMPMILYNTKKHFYLNPCNNNTL